MARNGYNWHKITLNVEIFIVNYGPNNQLNGSEQHNILISTSTTGTLQYNLAQIYAFQKSLERRV
jgi:hypothetical protein